MGGSGSGNWYRWNKKDTGEDHHGLDVRYLHRKRILKAGYYSISWSRGERKTGSIGYWGGEDSITLDYSHCKGGSDNWEDVKQTVRLSWTSCYFGGWELQPARGYSLWGGEIFRLSALL